MNWRAVAAILRKDLLVVRRSRAVILPMILVPLLLLVAVPIAFVVTLSAPALQESMRIDLLEELLRNAPPALAQQLAAWHEPRQRLVALALVYLFAPLFLVIPIMVATVIAADSFAGEKERRTLEALLHTPATDRELMVGKMLAAWLPAMGITLFGFYVYGMVLNFAAYPIMRTFFFPTALWWVLVLWVAPALAALGLGTTVVISSRTRSFQEAYQLAAVVVIPVLLLLVAQASGVLFLSVVGALALGALVWTFAALLLWAGTRLFRRGGIAGRF